MRASLRLNRPPESRPLHTVPRMVVPAENAQSKRKRVARVARVPLCAAHGRATRVGDVPPDPLDGPEPEPPQPPRAHDGLRGVDDDAEDRRVGDARLGETP